MSPLLLALLCMVTSTSVAADVLVLPLGVTREFVCTSPPRTGYAIAWGVNGTSATSSQFHDYIVLGEEVHVENGGIERNLTFIADVRANNTHILCGVTNLYDGEYMAPVDMNLTLQGQLPAPAVINKTSSDHHSMVFSWSAPFTLNISDMEPDILHYVVYIIRDDGHKDTVNTTDTHYKLQADPCQSHQYHVEIAAVNVVGEGDKYTNQIRIEGYAKAVVSGVTVSFSNTMVVIQISITLEASSFCHEFDMVKYEVELNATHSNDGLVFHSNGSAGQHTLNFSSSDIIKNELYDLSLRIEGSSSFSQSIQKALRTFDVQHVDTNMHDESSGYVDITCYFAKGSNAAQCKIQILLEYNSAATCEFVASKEKEEKASITIALPSGTYTLLVYGDEGAADIPAFNTTLPVRSSQVSECVAVAYGDQSPSPPTKYVILTGTLAFCIILVMGTAIAIVFTCARKHKEGKKQLPPGIEWNEYTSIQVEQSSSSESSDTSRTSSGSNSLEQSTDVRSTGHSHALQYADVHVTGKHTMTCPPPTSSNEPVTYATLQNQNTSSHSNMSQGTMDAGHLPGSYTPDDSN